MQGLLRDFDHNIDQINEIEQFNQSKIAKIAGELSRENLKKFNAIVQSQKDLNEKEREITKQIALKQSESSQKGLSILPEIEKKLDDLEQVTQIENYLALGRPIKDFYACRETELDNPDAPPLIDQKVPRHGAFL